MKLAPLLLSFFLSSPLLSANEILLPDMGDSTGTLISPAQEKALGASFFRSIQTQLEISNDPEVQHYIQSIGYHLVASSDSPSAPFHFFVVLADDINAFAGPGGFIGVNSGLILNSNNESELASVMAHEIAHVTQRHIYRSYEAASQLSLPAAAALIAAIVVATQAPDVGIGAISAVQAGSIQAQINFTRSNEQEADRVGIKTLAKAQFNPRSMPTFFEKLQQASRYYGSAAPEYLRTHPITSSRIADTRNRAESYPYRQVPDSQNYRLIKAKLRTYSAMSAQDLIAYFTNRLSLGTAEQKAAMQYGLALSYAKQERYQIAQGILKKLITSFPSQEQYLSASAHLSTLEGNTTEAKKAYALLEKRSPYNDQYKFSTVTLLIKDNQAQQALQRLKEIPYHRQNGPDYFLSLAKTYEKLSNPLNFHRYMAEYHYSVGQTHQAILQIKLAQKAKNNNFYLSAILEDRFNFFSNELLALKQLQE
ncbi:MAG: M48 family metalloprotease [Methyloprofundus sp.]|nr:M48 family metalloprotease [Methyloprofundus sp.]